MKRLTYAEQLRHPNWQRRRLEIMEAANFECENCGDGSSTLAVHHRRYVKGRQAWEYADHELQCLCEPCHQSEHQARDVLNELLAIGQGRAHIAVGLLTGYLHASLDIDGHEYDAGKAMDGYAFLAGAVGHTVIARGVERGAAAIHAARDVAKLNPAEQQILGMCQSEQAALDFINSADGQAALDKAGL